MYLGRGGLKRLGLLRFEETQKGRMLGEQGLDLGNAGASPVLDPRLAEVVLDVVEAAIAHCRKYRHPNRTALWAKWLI
jgi:hypothetical protein